MSTSVSSLQKISRLTHFMASVALALANGTTGNRCDHNRLKGECFIRYYFLKHY